MMGEGLFARRIREKRKFPFSAPKVASAVLDDWEKAVEEAKADWPTRETVLERWPWARFSYIDEKLTELRDEWKKCWFGSDKVKEK